MKLPKLKFDKATLQEFFLLHVEKIVLGVVVVLLVLFVYWGTQMERMKADLNSPKQLQEMATQTKTAIESQTNWTNLAEERKVDLNVKIESELQGRAIASEIYKLPKRFNDPEIPRQMPRTDPKIFGPKNVLATAIVGPLAIKRPNATGTGTSERPGTGLREDPLSDTVSTVNGVGGVSGYGTERPTPLERRENSSDKKTEKKRPTKKTPPTRPEDFMLEGPPPVGPMQGPGPGMNNAAGDRRFERDRGFVPSTDCTWETGKAVVIQAVVPWQNQFDEYRRCFEEAADFRIDRDLPNYLTYLVERADVTANPDADPKTLNWQTPVSADGKPYSANRARSETYRWNGFPAEVMDPDYLDIDLTHPAPPFMLRDLTAALTHPDVPIVSDEESLDPQRNVPEVMLDELGRPIELPEGTLPVGQNETHARQRTTFQHKLPSTPGTQPGGERTPYNALSGGESIDQAEQKVRQYKLIRFTDVTVLPGRKYRYRIKVVLEDPNRPRELVKEPSIASLEDPVKLRVKQVADKEAAQGNKRIFWVESEWSEPSPPIALPDVEEYLAANAQPASVAKVRDDRPVMVTKQATGRMVEVTWDKKHMVDAPVVVKVERGSAINFSGEAQVIHPVEGQIRKVEDFVLRKPAVVAEIEGGVTIEAQSKTHGKPLETPAEMLVFDEQGNWHMLNEAKDIDEVHRRILDETLLKDPEEKPATPAPAEVLPVRPPPGPGPGPGRGGK